MDYVPTIDKQRPHEEGENVRVKFDGINEDLVNAILLKQFYGWRTSGHFAYSDRWNGFSLYSALHIQFALVYSCTLLHCTLCGCEHRLGWSGDIWLHQRAAVDQYFASAWKQKTKHVAKKQWRSCWRSCVHIPLDHRTIRIMQIQKTPCIAGTPTYTKRPLERAEPLLGFPRFAQKSRHFSQKVPQRLLKAKFHWRWSTEDMFFFLGDQGTLLIVRGVVLSSYVFSICSLHKAFFSSHEIKITNPYGPISMYNLKCQLICWTMMNNVQISEVIEISGW